MGVRRCYLPHQRNLPMSDTTFRAGLVSAAPAAGVWRGEAFKALRAGLSRSRAFMATMADWNDTYGLIEAACLLTAAAFGTAMIVAAFGLRY